MQSSKYQKYLKLSDGETNHNEIKHQPEEEKDTKICNRGRCTDSSEYSLLHKDRTPMQWTNLISSPHEYHRYAICNFINV